jgi:hypothetical protein
MILASMILSSRPFPRCLLLANLFFWMTRSLRCHSAQLPLLLCVYLTSVWPSILSFLLALTSHCSAARLYPISIRLFLADSVLLVDETFFTATWHGSSFNCVCPSVPLGVYPTSTHLPLANSVFPDEMFFTAICPDSCFDCVCTLLLLSISP